MPSLPLPNDIGDEIVVLRPFGPGDVRAAFEPCRDPLIARHTTFPTPEHEEQTRAWILGRRTTRAGRRARPRHRSSKR